MKKTLIWCLLALLSLGSAAWSQAQMTGGTEKVVVALEDQWFQTLNTNSPDLLAPVDRKVTGKAEALAEVNTFVKNSAANS